MAFLVCYKTTAERLASRPSQSTRSDQVVTPRQPVPNNPKVRHGQWGQASADGFHEPGTAINRWCVGADVLVNIIIVVTLAG